MENSDIKNPILVIKYNPLRVFWKLIHPNGLGILLFGFLLFGTGLNLDEDGPMKFWFGMSFFGLLFIGTIFISLEIILMREIRFYKYHMEQEWRLFGKKSSKYNRLGFISMTGLFDKPYSFHYINEQNLLKRRCCSFNLRLLYKNDIEKIKNLLSKVSNRSKDEFEKTEIKFDPFVKINTKD